MTVSLSGVGHRFRPVLGPIAGGSRPRSGRSSEDQDRRGGGPPPVGRAFAVFAGAIVGLALLAGAEIVGWLRVPGGASSEFGVTAATTFGIAGCLAAYRAVMARNAWTAAIAAVLLGPGAGWSWSVFVADGLPPSPFVALVVVAAVTLAGLLLNQGVRLRHWLDMFGGLGSLGLAGVATLVGLDPGTATTAAPALLAAVAGMTCLYGLLVDVEVSEHRSMIELSASRREIEDEVARVEELLHDLRSGLLAIEVAVGNFDDELAAPLRSEAARLRRLTLTGDRTPMPFDLSGAVTAMVAARRAGGADIVVRSTDGLSAWGEESEILSIVDNLLSNAERHGGGSPITVEIAAGDGTTRLSVSNEGELPVGDPDEIFRRGVTTHPDGQGIGLARARMLAGVNGAELRIGPAPAGHATFVLSLRSEPPVAVAS